MSETLSLDVSAGAPASLEAPASAPARTLDVLLRAGCSSEEQVDAITSGHRETVRECKFRV